MNLIEATLGKKAVEDLLTLTVSSILFTQKKPELQQEVLTEYIYEFRRIVRYALSDRHNPEEVLILTESLDMADLMELFGELYNDEIKQRVSAGNDIKL